MAMILGPNDTGAFTSCGNCPLQQCPQEHFTCIAIWFTTVAAIGSGMSTTWRVARTLAESISRAFPHSGHARAGYHRSVPVTLSDWSRVLPRCPSCPPVFLPEGLRWDCVCRMPIGFLDGGTLLFALLFLTDFPSPSSSAIRDARSAMRASFTFISLSRTERTRSILASSLSFSQCPGKAPVGVCLDQQPLGVRGVKLVTQAKFPKYPLASPGELHPVRLDTLFKSRVEVLFHTSTKDGKIIDASKSNNLNINELEAVCRRFGGVGAPSFGGSFRKFFKVADHPQTTYNGLISSGFDTRMGA